MSPLRAFRFTGPDVRGFKLVVLARSRSRAHAYVRAQASNSLAHRALRFAGEGHPSNPESWCAARAA